MRPGEFDAAGFRHGRVTGDTHSWYTTDVATSNVLCPYCGAPLSGPGAVASNKEHLIARQFGPARVMSGNEFNLIFRACCKCNSEKSDLERHVSSITLFNGPGRGVDPAAAEAAARKALKDFHPAMPGVRVGDSHQQSSIEYRNPGMDINFGMHIPPQVHRPHAQRLAFMQMQGFYSFITSRDYQSRQGMSLLKEENFQFFGSFSHADWGNPQLLEVVYRVQGWEPLLDVETANGYFRAKLLMRQGRGWFWALEWNKWMRVVGGLCNEPMPLFDNLPELAWFGVPGNRRARREVSLQGADALFSPRTHADEASEGESHSPAPPGQAGKLDT